MSGLDIQGDILRSSHKVLFTLQCTVGEQGVGENGQIKTEREGNLQD